MIVTKHVFYYSAMRKNVNTRGRGFDPFRENSAESCSFPEKTGRFFGGFGRPLPDRSGKPRRPRQNRAVFLSDLHRSLRGAAPNHPAGRTDFSTSRAYPSDEMHLLLFPPSDIIITAPGCSSDGRARGLGPRGRWFETSHSDQKSSEISDFRGFFANCIAA